MWKFLRGLFDLFFATTQPRVRRVVACKAEAARPTSYVNRFGEFIPADEVFYAWTSGDLDTMLKALDVKTNLIDRHCLLQKIVDATYKHRNDEKMRSICSTVAELHLSEFPSIALALKKNGLRVLHGGLPHVTTFQLYATLLTEQKEFEKAIAVCESALAYGLHDNTRSGFEGRIERIKKKQRLDT
ncbi:MAG: hypothetical protein LBU76_08410 [Azoarcus sp.]|jgi:hypothetical protein|nr:hypothetical protein [Azoarcus sp.]